MWSEGSPLVWLSSKAGSPTSSYKFKSFEMYHNGKQNISRKIKFWIELPDTTPLWKSYNFCLYSSRVIIMRTLQCKRISPLTFSKQPCQWSTVHTVGVTSSKDTVTVSESRITFERGWLNSLDLVFHLFLMSWDRRSCSVDYIHHSQWPESSQSPS